MVIKIDDVNKDGISIIDNVLDEYVNAIKSQMFNKNSLVNSHNVIENSGLNDDFNKIIEGETALINSYIDNVLISFKKSLKDFKEFKEK